MLTFATLVTSAALADDCAPWLARLGVAGEPSVCQVRRFGPASTVVLAQLGQRVVLARFERRGGEVALAGATTDAFPGGQVDGDYVSGEPRLDLADYRVAPGRWAVGVRVGFESSCNGWNAACDEGQSLALFDDRTFALLFAARMETNAFTAHCDPPDSPTCGREPRRRYVLEVTDQLTEGHYDLVVRPEGGGEARVSRWSGDRYW